jgi:very-short-patch-repair endonuclease
VGGYILDFACLRAWLVIEVDGSQHGGPSQRDNRRTAWLESRGFRVLRFWDNDVLQQTDGVLETVHRALLAPPPRPSP